MTDLQDAKERFLALCAEGLSVTEAARRSGFHSKAHERWASTDR